MPYRTDRDELEARRRTLAKELADLTQKREQLSDVEREAAEVQKKLAETERMLEKFGPKPSMLENVRVASPCKADWERMEGDERVRFCGQCAKNVYNLSAMPQAEAEKLLLEKEGNLCIRLYRRADGTVLTNDCPVGVKKKRVRRLALATVGGGLLATAGVFGAASQQMGGMMPMARQHDVNGWTQGEAPPESTAWTTGSTSVPVSEPLPVVMGKPSIDPPFATPPAKGASRTSPTQR